jgi:hypothetical protein
MAKLSDVTIAENTYEAPAEIPEQRGGFKPLLQPGDYEFQLPQNLKDLWEPTADGKNISLVFSESPLIVSRARDAQVIGLGYYGQISSRPFNRARKGEPDVLVDDLTYLLKYGLKDDRRPKTKTELGAYISEHASGFFMAQVEWSANCNEKAVRFVADANGQSVADPSGKVGCAKKYKQYRDEIPRAEDGTYQERFLCQCGASLRCFGNLSRFRPATEG